MTIECKLCEVPIHTELDDHVQITEDSLICWECAQVVWQLGVDMKEVKWVKASFPEDLDEPQPEDVD